ncbi:MAG: DUF3352 domain-containing protein [Bacteroidales bacterium]
MKRAIFIWVLTSVLVFAAGFMLYLWLQARTNHPSDALRAVPVDASVIIKINSYEDIIHKLHTNKNEFWESLNEFDKFSQASSFFSKTESHRNTSPVVDQMLYKNQSFLSTHAVGKGTAALLYAANIPERVKPSDIIEQVDDFVGSNYTKEGKDYNGTTIYIYKQDDTEEEHTFCFAVRQGIVMASQSVLLIESAIGQLGSNVSLYQDKSFMDAYKTAGTRVIANVFLNHPRLPAILSEKIHPNHRMGIQNIAHTASWSELDMTLKNNTFYLNGFTQVPDTVNTFYKVFTKQRPVPINIPNVLPAQTAGYLYFGISNLEKYFDSYHHFLDSQGMLTKQNAKLDAVSSSLGANIKSLYSSIFGNELALAFIPFKGEEYNNCWFAIAKTKGQSMARRILKEAVSNHAKANGKSINAFESTFSIDREKSVKIYRLPKAGMHEALFGSMFTPVNDQYFTFVESYVVFGASKEALSRLILANIHNKQLAVESVFNDFSKYLAAEANFTAYINPGKAEMLYGHMLSSPSAAKILSRKEGTEKIQGLAIQLTGGKSMIFNNISASYSPHTFEAPQTVWETRLDTTFSMKPELVINHNTQNREIFVQDDKNNIYLINQVGRVLWKRPLPEQIMGDVHQVDVYRNGKLQFVFNTKSHLYLVDRNGNNVSGFPVKLRSPASNPLAVFDYENNRKYRFFIAGEDRKVYAYNKDGNIVSGWDFEGTEKRVYQPIQHFRMDGRDYIVMADENRPYILDRRGNERVGPNRFFSASKNSAFFSEASTSHNPAQFVTTDSLGMVRFIRTDGKVDEKAIATLSSDHTFMYDDVNGDGTNDYIFVDDNELMVFKDNGSKLFSREFPYRLQQQVIYFHFGSRDRKLGVMCSESSKIYLVNGDGSIYKGFPLQGITPFSIGRLANTKSTFNLIVGSSSGYVLNYAVQ